MSIQIQLRNDTAANWTTINPVLAQGEMGVENDTFKFKIGNGSTAWASLAYASSILGYTAENTANKGAASGYAGLDAFKRVLNSGEVITPNASFAGAGTVTTSTTTTTVSGTGTSFTTQLSVGDQITVGSQTQTVMAITSNTSLSVLANWTSAASGSAYTIVPGSNIALGANTKIYGPTNWNTGYAAGINFDPNTTITGIYLTGMVFTVYNGSNNSFIWKTGGSTTNLMTLNGTTGVLTIPGTVAVGSTGIQIKTGSGVPSNSDNSPIGSLYLNTAGGATTTLYVKTGASTWTAK